MTVNICEYLHGRILYFPGDPYHGRFLKRHGEYSEEEVTLFKQIVRPGDVVIEAGAHIGVHTIPLARMCAPGGLVFAFEPQIHIYHALCGNLALNSIYNVSAVAMAIGAEAGECSVPDIDYGAAGINFGGVSMLPPNAGKANVTMMALDMIADQLPALRLIKADVEGMETDVVIGAQNLIRRLRPFLYLEDDREERRGQLHALVRSLGYRLYRHQPPYVETDPLLVSVNMLCVPTEMDCTIQGLEEIA
jgi:FkbM family methyltransferase